MIVLSKINVLERALQAGRAFETNGLGGLDFHCFTSLRVAAHAGCTLLDFKGAKANELDFTIFFHTFGNTTEYSFKGSFCATLGCIFPEGILNGFDEFGFIHNGDLLPLINANVKLNNSLFFLGNT